PRAKNEQIPPALDALILRLLAKEPHDRPVSAAEVLRELEGPGFLDMDAIPARELSVLERIERGRLVGREQELQQAGALWDQTLSGQGQMLWISGEPGIGKTRLMREMITQVQVRGGRALVGACYAEGGTPYAPFRQMIREVVRDGLGQSLEVPESVWSDVLTLAPELRSRLPDVPPNPSLEPEDEQQRLLDNVTVFFNALSDHVPLLLVLEDVHWADSGSLFLLRHLARNSRRQRLMIIATYREVELDEARPLHQVLLDLTREHLAIRLKLPRLNRVQTGELLDVLFDEQTTPDLVAGVYRETEGNPFFIEEVCKALAESGKLGFADGRWQWPGIEELGIPQSVRIAIQSRVASLPDPAQQTLSLAAVLGREFDLQTLTSASEWQEAAVIDALETAERAQLIEEVQGKKGSTFSFVHGLIPTTLVEGLRTLQLRGLHARAAAAIEGQRPEDFEALAYHCVQAGLAPKAITYLLKAGDRARSLYAHQEAIDHYLQALDFSEEAELHVRARTWMRLGLTYHNAFQFSAARQAYEKGFLLWQQVGEAQQRTDTAPAPHALRLSWSNPVTLDPSMAADGASAAVIEELFDGLVDRSPEMEVIPAVARSWEVLESGTRYVFHLRGDALWSDGVQLTAGDFEYAWRRVLDPATGSPHASFLYDVAGSRAFHEGHASWDDVGVRAADERTLVVDLEGPRGHFLQLLANVATYPLPRHKVEALGGAWAALGNVVNNGPFVLQ
ncbi:MAG: AAA family ATPase, partial [Anaerolineales bacterium]